MKILWKWIWNFFRFCFLFFILALLILWGISTLVHIWTVSYRWVYIKANGEISKGTVYENDDWRDSSDPRSDRGELPEDGLLLTEGGYNDGRCARTYQLNGAKLRIDHGNDDLTEGIQITYQADRKLIAWGNTEQLHHFKESMVDGIRVAHVYQWIRPLVRYNKKRGQVFILALVFKK